MADNAAGTMPEKANIAHVEGDNVKVDGYDSYGLVKSTFDELSIPRTLWVFRRVTLVSLAVYTGYICEGFEVIDACIIIIAMFYLV
jgi:hypothetical protein